METYFLSHWFSVVLLRLPKIYFGTRTHKQVAQIVRELGKTAYSKTRLAATWQIMSSYYILVEGLDSVVIIDLLNLNCRLRGRRFRIFARQGRYICWDFCSTRTQSQLSCNEYTDRTLQYNSRLLDIWKLTRATNAITRAVKSCQKTHPGNRSRQHRWTVYT